MSVHEEVSRAVSAAIHNPMAYREAKENVFDLYTRLALDALSPFIDELEQARASHVRLMAACDRADLAEDSYLTTPQIREAVSQ